MTLASLPTRELARFIADSSADDLSGQVQREGRRGLLNALACVVAGRTDPALGILRRTFPGEDALLDAAAATAHDYDDTHLRTVIHATPPVAGAVLSLSRRRPVAGKDLLHAFILGLETTCRIGNAVMPGHYERGWHITSTCGVFGATVAAAKLLRLDESRVAHALGLAATQAAGLVEMLGSMARVLNAGFAARNGLAAALLAEQGFEGPREPLAGLRGFIPVFGGNADLGAITQALGAHWEMLEIRLKPYPSGVVLHALIDACLEQRELLREAPAITLRLHPLAIERTDRPDPRNAIEARLSAQHAVAISLLRGAAGLEEFSDAAAVDPEVRRLRRRVSVAPDASLDKMAASIRAGERRIDAHAPRAMDDARLEAKVRALAGPQAQQLLQSVAAIGSAQAFSAP